MRLSISHSFGNWSMRFARYAFLRQSLLIVFGTVLGFSAIMCLYSIQLHGDLVTNNGRTSSSCQVTSPVDPQSLQLARRELAAQNENEAAYDFSAGDESSAAKNSASSSKNLLFVGVMTAQKYVDTRALAINRTWAPSVPGLLEFFVAEHTVSAYHLPLVRLPGVDDTYPPQKKSFLMLKYMWENYGDKFEWFMRADDDAYVRGDRLELLLRSLDSTKPLFLGQAGLGTPEEYGLLHLGDMENYCMGGTGIIISRETLRRVVPHLRDCLHNLYTTHEDVEVGRCIRQYAGVTCTWSYEMQSIFYNNQSGMSAFSGDFNIDEIHKAITLHPLKISSKMYRMHLNLRKFKAADLRFRSLQLMRDVGLVLTELNASLSSSSSSSSSSLSSSSSVTLFEADQSGGMGELSDNIYDLSLLPSVTKFRPQSTNDLLRWDFLSPTVLYCADGATCPRHNSESYLQYAIDDAVRQTMGLLNKYARNKGRILEFQEIMYGYRRVDPLHGAEYVLDLLLTYKKFRGRRLNVPVRRHAYLQQAFAPLRFVADEDFWPSNFPPPIPEMNGRMNPSMDEIVHIVMPLSGRFKTFQRFLTNLEENCLQANEAFDLTVALFPSAENSEIIAAINVLKARYSPNKLKYVELDGEFNRARGLMAGANEFSGASLLFFTDVDVLFTREFLHRVRLNTVRGSQVFFPMVFSEYDPQLVFPNLPENQRSHFDFSRDSGYFRHFGFGLVSIFRSDLDSVGGLELNIKGWGLEDVDLFEKLLKRTNFTLFRAPEPGLIHVFHPVVCDSKLPPAQFRMCAGSKAASYASGASLSEFIYGDRRYASYFLRTDRGIKFHHERKLTHFGQ